MASMIDSEKSTILVTGCSGLVGRAVVRRLTRNYNVVGFDVKEPPEDLTVDFIRVDLSSDEDIQTAVDNVRSRYGNRVESIIHLAAYYDFSGEPSSKYEEITVRGTERLLRSLNEQIEVGQFIFSSTMLVHQPSEPGRPIGEKDPLETKWAYPQSKLETEHLLREQHGDMPVVLLRIAGIYTDTCDSIPLASQIQRIYADRITGHVFPGDISHGQAFVHLDDLVDAMEQVVERRAEFLNDQLPLLIGEPDTYSYQQLQQTLARLIHGADEWATEQIPKAVAKTGTWIEDKIPGMREPFVKPRLIAIADDHYELDISRAKELLDWRPRHRLIDTLPLMVEALKQDPVAWYKRHHLELPPKLQEERK